MDSKSVPDETRLNPRTKRVRRLILDSAIQVLLEHGVEEVTATRVAEQADVARTTIYRHWPDQPSLLLATIDALTAPHDQPGARARAPETDVTTHLRNLRTRLVAREVRLVFGALAARSASDGGFATAQHRFIEQLIKPLPLGLLAAQEIGTLPAEVDCQFEANLLAGSVLHQHLVLYTDVSDDLIDEVVTRWRATHHLT